MTCWDSIGARNALYARLVKFNSCPQRVWISQSDGAAAESIPIEEYMAFGVWEGWGRDAFSLAAVIENSFIAYLLTNARRGKMKLSDEKCVAAIS